ncbi:MAG: alpha/beta hydrolase [Myxococcales bacterium]|nr:alpha/beta fold hydrolase [Myxococcales bacterium]
MVLPGQYLERSVVVGDLDALYHRGKREPPCVIASPHPALGGSMISPVVAELAWALTRAGHPTMRFDYRGVGASGGQSRHHAGSMEIGDVSGELEDLYKITDQLLTTTGMPAVCAVGYSFGAKVALEAAQDARVSHLVLVAPPNRLADFGELNEVAKPLLVVLAHHDSYCDRAALQLPEQAKLEVVPHADHFFGRGLTEMGKTVATWLRGDRPEYVAPPDPPEEDSIDHREVELEEGPDLELDPDPK